MGQPVLDCGTSANMSEQPKPPRRRASWIVAVVVILVGLGVSMFAVVDQVVLRLRLAACLNPDSAVRIRALSHFADNRDARVSDTLAGLLERENNRAVLEMAGCTAMRIEDVALLDTLQRRASQEPDDPVRAKLILYTARLSRRDVRLIPWLKAGVMADQEPWRQVASAAGLLYLGEPCGGPALIALARPPDHPAHAFALGELNGLVRPMTEAVGWPITWPMAGGEPETAFWDNLDEFWKTHGSARLLNDMLTRRFLRDPRWIELGRLIHARDKVTKWFK